MNYRFNKQYFMKHGIRTRTFPFTWMNWLWMLYATYNIASRRKGQLRTIVREVHQIRDMI